MGNKKSRTTVFEYYQTIVFPINFLISIIIPNIINNIIEIKGPIKPIRNVGKEINNNKGNSFLAHHFLFSHALHHALNKKYAANPNIETTKTPIRIASRGEGSSSSDSIASIFALLSTTGNEA